MSTAPDGSHAVRVNRTAWDLRTGVHLTSDFYPTRRVRAGGSTLKPPERELVGEVRGLRLLHLQCHFGLDTLSWARLGARATGVDLSPVAVRAARRLAAETGLDARFVCADVQGFTDPGAPYDVVVSTYGVLCWLGDLPRWADSVAHNLRPGGRFVLVEFHPLLEVLHPGKVSGAGRYFGPDRPPATWTQGTYADPAAPIRYREYRWQHPVGSVLDALIAAGLVLERVEEYPYSSYRLLDELDRCVNGVWVNSRSPGRLPYMYAVVARAARGPRAPAGAEGPR
ncbi:hypothetical protein AQ490_11325 [Wenjunlia vitaminophila]|uniref:Methyltransferase domain-containing protein n=1 Tax=Wenjunlia vitaminophila TaxID=76728 RepID=A0A0T6LKU9_WENVI|nr:class I SAM-dependent methyltransferase [Wenjunlia vitaminophila]KRV46482.1 hypothetical protein AQ490_11325 [Wenjunlia vitaminophila]